MKFYRMRQNSVYLLTFIVCLAISAGISWKAYEWQRESNYENFRHLTRESFFFIKKSIEWHEEGLLSLANYYKTSQFIDQDEFLSYTNYSVHSRGGYHALGWILPVKPGETDGRKYRIGYMNTDREYVRHDQDQVERDARFINAVEHAVKTRATFYTIEKNIISVSEHNHILILHPVFLNDSLFGVSFSVVDIPKLIQQSVDAENPYFHTKISASIPGQSSIPLYDSPNAGEEIGFYKREKSIDLNGLSFNLTYLPTREFLQEHNFVKTYALFIGIYLLLCTLAILYFRQMNIHIVKIREAQRKAEESNRLKNDFLATMSHEIRSPMSGVLGMAELLLGTNLTNDQRGYTQTILSSGEVLLNIIEDILDVSKIEANKLKIDPVPLNMLDLVDDVCALYFCKSQEKAVELAVRYIPGSEQFVYADPVRVRQVLGNLINNAIKFTEKGHVIVTVHEDPRTKQDKNSTTLVFSVEDSGIGINKDAMERIFEQFSQADSSTTRNYGGTGLGLTISKKLVQLMGGEISVISEPGKGSTFSFYLPLRRNAEENFAHLNPPVLAGTRVLAVDDFSVIGSILKENLELNGMSCTWEPDPEKAVSLLEAARAAGKPYHIAIVDFLMPSMNGEALARHIKSHPDLKDTCLIMLTAAGNPSTDNMLAKDCFSAYLAKPIRIHQFIEKLAVVWGMYSNGYRDTLIKTDSFAFNAEETHVFMPLTGVQILLAEDSRINQAFAMDVLEQLSCQVTVAINGEEAVRAVREKDFDIVLMDCQMPVMDGFDASRQIVRLKKEGVVREDLPIIALTANAMEGDRERCLDAGMNDYLSKPVRAKELREKVYEWLDMGDSMYIVPPAQGAGPALKKENSASKDVIVDPESVQSAQKILKDKYDDIVTYFIEDTQNYIAEIDKALKDHKFADGIRPAHTIKSTSQRMGAVKLSNCAKEIEAMLKKNENDNFEHMDVQDLAGYLTHLRLIFDQTRPLLAHTTKS